MEATMQLDARQVQMAVMQTPTLNLGEALAAARRGRTSVTSLIGRVLGTTTRSPDPDSD